MLVKRTLKQGLAQNVACKWILINDTFCSLQEHQRLPGICLWDVTLTATRPTVWLNKLQRWHGVQTYQPSCLLQVQIICKCCMCLCERVHDWDAVVYMLRELRIVQRRWDAPVSSRFTSVLKWKKNNNHLCENIVYCCWVNADFKYRNADSALDVLPWLTQSSDPTSVCVHLCMCVCVFLLCVWERICKCEVGGQEKPK